MGVKKWMVGLLNIYAFFAWAQPSEVDSLWTVTLSEVQVNPDRLSDSEIGWIVVVPDSNVLTYMQGSGLDQLMRNWSAGEIRSYGPGGLTSPSIRGMGSAHTAIAWNGINLSQPLLGQQDLSHFPVGLGDNWSIQRGGASSLYGSGAIGGTIKINNRLDYKKGFSLRAYEEFGSFGRLFQQYQAEMSGGRVASKTQFFSQQLSNDFTFQNEYVNPKESQKREHSAINRWGVQQHVGWIINPRHQVGAIVQYTESDVEVPNSVLSGTSSDAEQYDRIFRGLTYYHFDQGGLGISYKQALILHQSDYEVPITAINSENDFLTWVNQLQTVYQFSEKANGLLGVQNEMQQGDATNFSRVPQRNLTALTGSLRLSPWTKLKTSITVREELVNGKFTPLSPSVGWAFEPLSGMAFRGTISRNYRVPTFNDLYWTGAGASGNRDLRAETSWNEELGLDLNQPMGNHKMNFSFTGFNARVRNWILWLPVEANLWSPDNVREVWSRGFETNMSFNMTLSEWRIRMSTGYHHTRSTIEESDNRSSNGNQLLYTPIHSMNGSFMISYKDFSFNTLIRYVGKQYSDEGNTEINALDPYTTINLFIGKAWSVQRFGGMLRLDLNNLTDEQYENRRGYPMHGRNFAIAISINLNSKSK